MNIAIILAVIVAVALIVIVALVMTQTAPLNTPPVDQPAPVLPQEQPPSPPAPCDLDCADAEILTRAKNHYEGSAAFSGRYTMNPTRANQVSENSCDIEYNYVSIPGNSYGVSDGGFDKRRFVYQRVQQNPCTWAVQSMGVSLVPAPVPPSITEPLPLPPIAAPFGDMIGGFGASTEPEPSPAPTPVQEPAPAPPSITEPLPLPSIAAPFGNMLWR